MQLLIRVSLGVMLVAIVLLAVLSGAIRLAISNIEYFKSEIEYLIERDVAEGFVYTGLGGAMNRWNPILTIENVSITLPDRSQPLFIDRLAVEFDFWASLREWAPVVLEISGQLEKIEVHKDAAGKWWANELSLAGGGGEISMPGFERLLSLVPRYLKLNLNRLVVHDLAADTRHQLQRVQAFIDHRGQQFFVKLSAALPPQLGRGLLLKSVIGPERSLVYLNSSNLELNPVARLFGLDTWGVQQGALDGEVWIDMAGYRVLAVSGDLVLKKGLLQMAADKTPLELSYHSRFNAEGRDASWHITNKFERLHIDGKRVPAFRTQLEFANSGPRRHLDLWVDRLQLASLPVVAGQWLPRELNLQIAQGRLQGMLHDLLLRIDLEQPQQLVFGGRAENLSSQRFDEYPGIENIDAEFVAGGNRLGLRLEGKQVSLDFGDHFDAPLEIDSLQLEANLDRVDQTLLLAVDRLRLQNQDIEASGRLWLQADHLQQPFTYIRANFANGNGASASKYIPRNITPDKTQAWLDRAIVAGHVSAGDMLFHGRLRDIRELARERAGEFYVDFGVERAQIDFSPGWLPARDAAGRVLFHNAGVKFDIDRGAYDRIEQARATGAIPNFDEPVLQLKIESLLDTARAVQTWVDMPVGKRYRQVMQNVDGLAGNLQAQVELKLPLSVKGGDLEVRVVADFENVSAKADSWGLELTQINGPLTVTESEISARRLQARFFGDPVSIDIASEASTGATLVKASGVVESRNLLRSLPAAVTAEIDGNSDWQVRLTIPEADLPQQPFLRINAASNLRQTGITLPQPFTKDAGQVLRVAADLDFFADRVEFSASLGDTRYARGRLAALDAGGYQIDALDLALQTPLRKEPPHGLNLYGQWPELELERWVAIIADTGVARPELLRSADLRIDRLQLFQQSLENVELVINRLDTRYIGSIDSSLVKGNFEVPSKPTRRNPVTADLAYLVIEKSERPTDYSALRPGQFKSFRLHSDSVSYHGIEFSELLLEARASDNLLQIDRIGLRRDQVKLEASASWKYLPASDSHESSLAAKLRGENFGAAIAALGFGDSMSGGKVEFDAGLTWKAPLPGFELGSLKGDASLKIEDGVLNNVEPGSGGRFVGLLSLSALPRRLALDFSDLLVEGMKFDSISGRYQLKKGIIQTRNMRMDGPSAKIKISGETNIVDRSYDQQIKVTPKIRQTLPLLGAVSAGSTVGWGLLLLQNLFKKAIDDAVEVEYRITGSWDDPQIELIKAVDENQQELPELPEFGDRSR